MRSYLAGLIVAKWVVRVVSVLLVGYWLGTFMGTVHFVDDVYTVERANITTCLEHHTWFWCNVSMDCLPVGCEKLELCEGPALYSNETYAELVLEESCPASTFARSTSTVT